jgi:phytoene/squalene synthetase
MRVKAPRVNAPPEDNSTAALFARARDHTRENFSVLSCLVPRDLRADFITIYTFCRYADDIGDCYVGDISTARELALERLDRLRQSVVQNKPGDLPPTYIDELASLRERRRISTLPFERLIDAFEQDQRTTRYLTWDELLKYCDRSANPVGHLVLMLFGYRPPEECNNNTRALFATSDDICSGLQLANFWQDVRRDLFDRDRIYVPLSECNITERDLRAWAGEPMPSPIGDAVGASAASPGSIHPFCAALRPLVDRTQSLFDRGQGLFAELHRLPDPDRSMNRARDCRRVVRLFASGGELVNRKVRATGYTTLWQRPKVSRADKLLLLIRHLLG